MTSTRKLICKSLIFLSLLALSVPHSSAFSRSEALDPFEGLLSAR